ncbi:MAG TPA: hypothetical protein VEG61_00565 [Candidatus Dormibacteraeota bacterium]|nr:hypothetical protein [Candidatus Dormibacteraeota bacterium]
MVRPSLICRKIAVTAVGIYGAYWAFAIRQRLVGRLYRNHALWLGVLCVLIAMPSTIPSLTNNSFISTLVTIYNNPPLDMLVAFAFIDSTIPVVRRSDPHLRRLLNWGKVRIVIWSVLALNVAVTTYVSIYLPTCMTAVRTGACIRAALHNLRLLGLVVGFLASLGWLVSILFLIPAAAALLIGAKRSMDLVLRESVKWLGLALLCVVPLVLVAVVEGPILHLSYYYTTYSYGAVPWNVSFILLGYALYRSARSLVPLNRLAPIETEMPTQLA